MKGGAADRAGRCGNATKADTHRAQQLGDYGAAGVTDALDSLSSLEEGHVPWPFPLVPLPKGVSIPGHGPPDIKTMSLYKTAERAQDSPRKGVGDGNLARSETAESPKSAILAQKRRFPRPPFFLGPPF